MDIAIWIAQVLLGIAFLGTGFTHATQRERPRPGMEWMQAVPAPLLTTIGILEVLGGIGLILPAAIGVLPVLTPLAASALAVLMVLAALFHARRPGELRNIAFNLVLSAIAVFVAVGRFVLAPLE